MSAVVSCRMAGENEMFRCSARGSSQYESELSSFSFDFHPDAAESAANLQFKQCPGLGC